MSMFNVFNVDINVLIFEFINFKFFVRFGQISRMQSKFLDFYEQNYIFFQKNELKAQKIENIKTLKTLNSVSIY